MDHSTQGSEFFSSRFTRMEKDVSIVLREGNKSLHFQLNLLEALWNT